MKGLYLPDGGFIRFADDKRESLLREAATRQRMQPGMQWFLPNPDAVLRKLGQSITVYRDLSKDPAVGGLLRRRRAAVLRLARGIDPAYRGPEHIRKDVEAMLARLNVARIVRETLHAPLYGYQPLEIVWVIEDGRYLPRSVTAKPPEWFAFDQDNQLLLRTPDAPLGEAQPPCKYIVATQDASYDNPYGEADLAMCFWPVAFKRGGLKFWVKFTERYGMPMVFGKLPRGTGSGTDSDTLLDQLEKMVQDAVAVIPDDASVELLEVRHGSGHAELYERLLMFCRSEISIALVGSNQTTEANSNRASATAGLEVADDIRDGDAEIVGDALSTLISYYCALNHDIGPQEVPRYRLWEVEDQDAMRDRQAKRSRELHGAGARFTPQYFLREYGLQPGDLDAGRMNAAAGPAGAVADAAFTENRADIYSDQDGLDAALEQVLAQALPGAGAALLEPVLAELRTCTDAQQALARLPALLPQMDAAQLQESLRQLLFVADTVGRLSAQAERTP